MGELRRFSGWTRHFVYRAERTRTTWKLRLGVLAVAATVLGATSARWTGAIGRSLVCEASLAPSDAILVENLEPDYLLYERARVLREAGLAPRVLVPVFADPATAEPRDVAAGIAEVMARMARLDAIEIATIREAEPITLHAAEDVRRELHQRGIRSVIVVTQAFRSRRSALVYEATLERAGITVHCDPVQGSRGVDTWTDSWHGIQDVTEQWLKLWYYRLYVLPTFTSGRQRPATNRSRSSVLPMRSPATWAALFATAATAARLTHHFLSNPHVSRSAFLRIHSVLPSAESHAPRAQNTGDARRIAVLLYSTNFP